MKNMKINKKKIENLNEVVLKALDFFSKNPPKNFKTSSFKFPLVIGSGNAINAGKLIFGEQAALFATESNFKEILKNYQELFHKKIIKEAVVISASGEKDSVWEIELAKKIGLKTSLLTCSKNSSAGKIADKTFIFEKLPEPYTYNVSTYLGMILAAKGEKAENIKKFIKALKIPNNFSSFAAYSFILPDKFAALAPMIDIKRHELFGPRLSLRAFSEGEARHAKFVIDWDKELIISFGKNKYFGEQNRKWEINLNKNYDQAFMMALSYYIVGLIQETKNPYFKKNIASYCQKGPKAYGQKGEFQIIVE